VVVHPASDRRKAFFCALSSAGLPEVRLDVCVCVCVFRLYLLLYPPVYSGSLEPILYGAARLLGKFDGIYSGG
jgi:hypothetical protein